MKKKPRKKSPPTEKHDRRQAILESVLVHVPFDGWTEASYARGLKTIGLTRGEADLLLPQGLRDLVDLFGAWADDAMLTRMREEPGFSRFRVRDKIAFGVRARLEFLAPYREVMRRLMAWYAMPLYLPLGVKRLSKTVDLIWREAGDASTDFNFYTKRILLAGVVKLTILFWLDDETPGSRASWEFLDRRIAEVLKVGKSISLLKEWKPSEILDFVRRKMRSA